MQVKPIKFSYFTMINIITTLFLLMSAFYNSTAISVMIMLVFLGCILKPEYIIPVYLLSSLSSSYFGVLPGLGTNRYIAIIIMLGVFIGKLVRKEQFHIPNMVFLTMIFLTSIYSTFIQQAHYTTTLYTMLVNIAVFITFANINLGKYGMEELAKETARCFCMATLLFAFILMLNHDMLTIYDYRASISQGLNPNGFAIMCAQMGVFLFTCSLLFKSSKRLLFIMSIVNFIIVIITGSRSAFFGFVIGVIFIILLYGRAKNIKLSKFFILMMLLAMILVLAYYIISTNPLLASRFNLDEIVETGGTGRLYAIQGLLLYVIPQNLWFGVGVGSQNEVFALSKYLLSAYPAHNFFVSMLAQIGVIGFIIYNSFFAKIIISAIKKLKECIILLLPLSIILTGLFNGIGEIVFTERWFWNGFALIVLIYANNKYVHSENNFNQ